MGWINKRGLAIAGLGVVTAFYMMGACYAATATFQPHASLIRPGELHQLLLAQSPATAVVLSPTTVNAGATATLTLTANGTVDLSGVTAAQIGVRPMAGLANLQIVSQSAQTLTLTFDVGLSAAPGARTLFVVNASGAEIVALDLQVVRPSNLCVPACRPGESCVDNQCQGPPANGCNSNPCDSQMKCCPDTPGPGLHECVDPAKTCPNSQ